MQQKLNAFLCELGRASEKGNIGYDVFLGKLTS